MPMKMDNLKIGKGRLAPEPIPVKARDQEDAIAGWNLLKADPPKPEPPRPAREVARFRKQNFQVRAGFIRIGPDDKILRGDYIVRNGYPIDDDDRYANAPNCTIRDLKTANHGMYDDHWVYRRGAGVKDNDVAKREYVSKVTPLPLP